jgi:hypothetical protein
MDTQIAPSTCIDQAAMGQGFSQVCRPLITGGSPQAILLYAGRIAELVGTLTTVLNQLQGAKQQLGQVWPSGNASGAAITKLAGSYDAFGQLLQTATKLGKELTASAGQLDLATKGCNLAIQATEPKVAALQLSPYTKPAATAMAIGCTTIMSLFLKGIGSVLAAIGQGNIGSVLSAISTITGNLTGNGATRAH